MKKGILLIGMMIAGFSLQAQIGQSCCLKITLINQTDEEGFAIHDIEWVDSVLKAPIIGKDSFASNYYAWGCPDTDYGDWVESQSRVDIQRFDEEFLKIYFQRAPEVVCEKFDNSRHH